MTGVLSRLALAMGLPKWLLAVLAALLAAGAVWGAWSLWLSNHDQEVVTKHESGIDARLQKQGRAADQNLSDRAASERAAQSEARKEFDNATAHVPRTGLTARQRIDACNELRAAGTDQAILARAKCL